MEQVKSQTFTDALRIQFRVLNALVRREFIAMCGRQGLGFLMMFIEPFVLIVFIMGLVLVRSQRLAHTFPLLSFVVSGWGIMYLCRLPIQRVGPAVSANVSFLVHRQITVLDIVVARSIMMVFSVLTCIVFIFLIYLIFLLDTRIYSPEHIVLGFFYCIWYSFVSCMVTATVCSYTVLGNKFLLPFAASHVFLTGAFFMVDWLPSSVHHLVLLLPMVNATEMVRYGMFGNIITCYFSGEYVFFFMIFYTFFSLRFLYVKTKKGYIHGMS